MSLKLRNLELFFWYQFSDIANNLKTLKFSNFRLGVYTLLANGVYTLLAKIGLHYRMAFPGNQIFPEKIGEISCPEHS